MTETRAKVQLIDVGVNFTDKRLQQNLDDVLERAWSAGVIHSLATGTSLQGSRAAVELCEKHAPFMSCTAGVHPHVASGWNPAAKRALAALGAREEVVAVGECGLDFNRDFSPRDQQEKCFAEQLSLAAELGKPVFLHERDAHARFIGILAEQRDALAGAVVHCFTGDLAQARAYLDLGCYLGITGWLCDERRGHDLRGAVRHVPLDRMLLETDAPYLVPRNIRPRPKRNEPAFLPHIAQALSQETGKSLQEVAAATTANARRLFRLKG